MRNGTSTIERAYQIAQSGSCELTSEIERQLSREGYLDARGQLESRALRKELRRVMAAARRWRGGLSAEAVS